VGPRFKTPKSDGTFEKAGKEFSAFYDPRNARAIFETEPGNGKIQLRDSRDVSFRYYRWLTGNPTTSGQITNKGEYNVPEMVGDPEADISLRDAKWAIVAAGANGLFGDEGLLFDTYGLNHPQSLDWDKMAEKLGINGSSDHKKIYEEAKKDNVVEVGR
jgi:hypothetical protein